LELIEIKGEKGTISTVTESFSNLTKSLLSEFQPRIYFHPVWGLCIQVLKRELAAWTIDYEVFGPYFRGASGLLV